MQLSPHVFAGSRPSHTAITISLIVALLCAAFVPLAGVRAAPLAPPAGSPASAAAPSQLKVVIVVGPTHSSTSRYLGFGESLALLAESYGMDVRRIFHPNATAERLAANIQGANIVAYFGHGNGWPSPYAPFQERTKNGMGLNPFQGGSASQVEYYGGNWFRNNAVLADNAVVLFGGLCYAEGNGEPGMGIPGWDVARQRVDNFAAAFLAIGAGAVYAYGWQSVNVVLDQLMTTDKTVDEIFMTKGRTTSPSSGFIDWDDRYFDSQRMPGFRQHLDPHPQEGFLRAVTGRLNMSASAFRGGEPGGGITPSPTPTPTGEPTPTPTTAPPPSQPQGLAATLEPNRVVKLSWQPSTSSVAGTMRYRVLRNGIKLGVLTTATSFTDQPAAGVYHYKVRAVDPNGVVSADSSPVTVTVAADATPTPSSSPSPSPTPTTTPAAPLVPPGLAATQDGGGKVTLTWGASTSSNSSTIMYRVFRNGNAIGTQQTSRTFTDTLAREDWFKYQVRAIDGAGYKSALSPAVWIEVELDDEELDGPDTVAPSAVSSFSATSLGHRRVELSWGPSTDDRAGILTYQLFRGDKRIATLTERSYVDRPRTAGARTYWVRAVDAAGNRGAWASVKGIALAGSVD